MNRPRLDTMGSSKQRDAPCAGSLKLTSKPSRAYFSRLQVLSIKLVRVGVLPQLGMNICRQQGQRSQQSAACAVTVVLGKPQPSGPVHWTQFQTGLRSFFALTARLWFEGSADARRKIDNKVSAG